MGFLSAKELRKKRFTFRKSHKKEQQDEQQQGTDEKEKESSNNNKTNNKNKKNKNAAKSVVATTKITKVFLKKEKQQQQQIQQKNLEPPEAITTTATTPRTVIDDDDDDYKMTGGGGGGGGTPGSPERNLSYTRSTDSRDAPALEEDGEGNYAAGELSLSNKNRNLLGQINVVEDDIIQDVIGGGGGVSGVDNDENEEEGTEIVVGKLPSHKKDPEGNIPDDVQHYNNNKAAAAAAAATDSSATNITIRVPYNPNEINNNNEGQQQKVEDGEVKLHVEVGQEQAGDDDDYDEYPADELRQSLSAPMVRSSSSATAKNHKQQQQQQQQRHVAERSNPNNNNRNYGGDDDDHVLKTDPPLVSSKSIDLGDLKDNAEYTARKLLGVFSCVPEEIQQRTYRAVEGVGTVVETGCDMPAAVCQQMGMNPQGKRGIKRNLSFYNDQFAVKFLDEILNVGFAVIHHVQSGDGDWSGRSATLILRPGTCNANNHTPPRLEWSSMGGGTQSHIETDSVSLLQIHSLTSSSGDHDDDGDDSFNNDDDEEKEELQCLFTLTTTEGIIEVFEAITPDETAKLVTGIKNISAKFAQQLISGDDHAFTDYYSQHSDTDFIKLEPPEAMSLMTHDFLDSL